MFNPSIHIELTTTSCNKQARTTVANAGFTFKGIVVGGRHFWFFLAFCGRRNIYYINTLQVMYVLYVCIQL